MVLKIAKKAVMKYNKHFSFFKTFVDTERRLAILLNPKVLTTFTRKFLCDGLYKFHGRSDPSEGRYRFFNNARRFPVARLKEYHHFYHHSEEYDILAFVRNPYSRVFSGWRDKFYDGHNNSLDGRISGYPRSMRRSELKVARSFCRSNGLMGGSAGELVPFDSFIRYLAAIPEGNRNQHWDQQALILQQPQLKLSSVFQIEGQLRDGICEVARRLDFDESWAVEQLGRKANASSRHIGPNPFTRELAELVYVTSKADFELFKYSKDSYKLLWGC